MLQITEHNTTLKMGLQKYHQTNCKKILRNCSESLDIVDVYTSFKKTSRKT